MPWEFLARRIALFDDAKNESGIVIHKIIHVFDGNKIQYPRNDYKTHPSFSRVNDSFHPVVAVLVSRAVEAFHLRLHLHLHLGYIHSP